MGIKFEICLLLIFLTPALAYSIDFNFYAVIPEKIPPGDEKITTLVIQSEVVTGSSFPLDGNLSSLLPALATAKNVRIEPKNNYPIEVESIEHILGDMPSGIPKSVQIKIKVDESALPGEYEFPIEVHYTKIELQTNSLVYSSCEKTVYGKVKVEGKDYDFQITSLRYDLKEGKEGRLEIEIENSGSYQLKNATLLLNVTPPFFADAKASSAFLGTINPGERAKAIFRLRVAKNAEMQMYPVQLILTADNARVSKYIGLKIENHTSFIVEEVKSLISEQKIIPQTYRTSSPYGNQTQSQMIAVQGRGAVFAKIKILDHLKEARALLSFETPLLKTENSQFLGDLNTGEEVELKFYVYSSAPPSNYCGKISILYKNEFGEDEITESDCIDIAVMSSPLEIKEVHSNVALGVSGDLGLTIRNPNNFTISEIELFISTPPNIIPTSSVAYIDELKPGEERSVKFRAISESVSAEAKLYLIERFRVGDARDLITVQSFSIPISAKTAKFEILSVSSELYPDSSNEIRVTFRNSGNYAKNVVVELSVSPPLSISGAGSWSGLIGQSQSGVYFVGSVPAGEVAVANFKLKADKDAGSGYYPATLKIRYEDEEGYLKDSSPITISIAVRERPILNALTVTVIALFAIGIILTLKFAKRRKK